MLTPPTDLSVERLAELLTAGWAIRPSRLEYRPVGWGSHHWSVGGADGARWFVTVDDLLQRQMTCHEPLDRSADRLAAALSAAAALQAAGDEFVVAAVPDREGGVVRRLGERYAVAVHPYVEGQSFPWGHEMSADHRVALLDMVIGVHGADHSIRDLAPVDDFVVPYRDELAAELAGSAAVATGPFARRVADLVAAHRTAVTSALTAYDSMVGVARRTDGGRVLTHGEPHPGNTMHGADGRWRLIDWDTARAAPPERDLWLMDPGDGSVLTAYRDATGFPVRAELLELYRRRWDLADVAVDVARFRRPHDGSEEDAQAFALLEGQLRAVAAS